MTIQELADQAQVTTRTIRYYVEEGLLPPPGYGRPAEYTEEHLRRLELIRQLKGQYLPLEEIRDTMQHLELAQVEDLLASTNAVPIEDQAHRLDSAAEYITQVLQRGSIRESVKRNISPPAQAPLRPLPAAPAASATRVPTQSAKRAKSAVAVQAAPEVATWQRAVLAPGIELHWTEPQDSSGQTIVRRLLEAAGQILEEAPGK